MHFEGGQGRAVKKYPLLRGKLRNKAIHPRLFTVRLSRLEKIADTGEITLDLLQERGIVPAGMSAKIVFDRPVSRALTIHIPVSARVAQEIKRAGGNVL
jgi:ribosomal protein L15